MHTDDFGEYIEHEPRDSVAGEIQFTDLPLRHPCDQCGHAYGYTRFGDAQRYAYCSVCDKRQSGYAFSKQEVFGQDRDRENRFVPALATRSAVLKRDQYRCVHCGNERLTAAEAQSRLLAVLDAEFGLDWRRIADEYETERCGACHQYLPGVVLQVPHALLEAMTAEGSAAIARVLRQRTLEVDHLISVAIQNKLPKPIDRRTDDFLRKRLLVTSCGDCNIGRGTTLAPLPELETIVQRFISQNERERRSDLETLRFVYFNAQLAAKKLAKAAS